MSAHTRTRVRKKFERRWGRCSRLARWGCLFRSSSPSWSRRPRSAFSWSDLTPPARRCDTILALFGFDGDETPLFAQTILYKLKLGEIVTTIPTIGAYPARAPELWWLSCRIRINSAFLQHLVTMLACGDECSVQQQLRLMAHLQASTSRRSSIRTSHSQCGTSADKTRFVRFGATTSRTHRQPQSPHFIALP